MNNNKCVAYLPLLPDGELLHGAYGIVGDRTWRIYDLAVQWRTGWDYLHEHRLLGRLLGRV